MLFEDFNQDYNRVIVTDPMALPEWCGSEEHRTPSFRVGAALATRATSLESLSASYMVEAFGFFDAASKADCEWPHLASLHLTSSRLRPSSDARQINDMLELAARVVLRMPALKSLVIWYGTRGVASEFRYEVSPADRTTCIHWRATFPFAWGDDAVEAWRTAAATRDVGVELSVQPVEDLEPWKDDVYSHGAAMCMLGLGGHVIHPISLERIRCETTRYWFTE